MVPRSPQPSSRRWWRRRQWTPFEKRKRLAARLALYGSFAVSSLIVALLTVSYLWYFKPRAERMPWVGVDYASMPEVQLLQRYLRIDTSQPDADEESGARFLASVLEEAGIPYTLQRMGERHANLWAWLDGESPEAVVLHSHIDTDPVDEDEPWEHGPFSGAIDPPYIYGRGAYDMKATTIAQLQAFVALAESDRPLRRSVLFLATGSEEVGSDLGVKWILENRPEMTERFWVFLTEGGVVETRSRDEVMYWGVEFAQRRYVDVWLCAAERDILDQLREEIVEERRTDNYQVRLVPEVETFLRHYAPTRHRPRFRELLGNPEHLQRSRPAWDELTLYLKSLFRDEILPFPVEEIPGGGGYQLPMKLHLLPGSSAEQALDRLLPSWRTQGLTMTLYDEGGADHGSPLDHPAYRRMVELLAGLRPGDPVGPLFLPATATDARFARARGIPAYGFSPFLISSTDTFRIGFEEERMYLPGFVDGLEVYRDLVESLVY